MSTGDYSPKEIARMVSTSLGNVYKEASLFRKSGGKVVFVNSRKTRIVSSPEGRQEVSRTEKLRLEVEKNDHVSVRSLEEEELKSLYSDFISGKRAAEIIAASGRHPEAVEIEHRRYLRMSNSDRTDLLEKIFNFIIDVHSEEIDKLKEKYTRTGSLENGDVIMLIIYNNIKQQHVGEKELLAKISDTSKILPDGCVRPLCQLCNAPIEGMLVLQNTHAEKELSHNMLYCLKHTSWK